MNSELDSDINNYYFMINSILLDLNQIYYHNVRYSDNQIIILIVGAGLSARFPQQQIKGGSMTKIITDKQIQSIISWSDAIECVENTWKWYGEGKVIMPTKVTTDMTSMGVPGWFNSMPSYIGPMDAAGLKHHIVVLHFFS